MTNSPATFPTRLTRARIPTVVLFAGSSLSSWSLDYVLVLVLSSATGQVLAPVVAARLVSSTVNFLVNRRLFTGSGQRGAGVGLWSAALGYTAVQATVMASSYLLIRALGGAGMALWLAKIVADSCLFVVNYLAQSHLYRSADVLARLRRAWEPRPLPA